MSMSSSLVLFNVISKNVIAPIVYTSVSEITINIMKIKSYKSKTLDIKTKIDELDLIYKITIINDYINDIDEVIVNKKFINYAITGIVEVLEIIKKDVELLYKELDYLNNSWHYTTIGWIYYYEKIDINKLKNNISILESRFEMLIKLLMTHNKNNDKLLITS